MRGPRNLIFKKYIPYVIINPGIKYAWIYYYFRRNYLMDIIKQVPPAEVKMLPEEDYFEKLFDDLVTKNQITKDVTIGDLTLTLKPLSTAAHLEAETVYIATVSTVPADVINRVRAVSNLSYAVEAINGHKVEKGDKDKDREARSNLYTLLMKLPPAAVDIINNHYIQLLKEHNSMYEGVNEKIENF